MTKNLMLNLIMFEKLYNSRLEALKLVLQDNNINYSIDQSNDINNVIVNVDSNKSTLFNTKHIVIGAHYDAYPGSMGLNDNYCAVAALIKFIINIKDKELNETIKVVFFDKEEILMAGSTYYVDNNLGNIKYALIFDIVGYGDNLLYCKSNYPVDINLEDYGLVKLGINLPSDNLSFDKYGIPNHLIVSLPKDDYEIMGGGEVNLKLRTTFHDSFHNGIYDNNLDYLTWDTVEGVYKFLKKLYSPK